MNGDSKEVNDVCDNDSDEFGAWSRRKRREDTKRKEMN